MSTNKLTKAQEKKAREKEAADRKFCKPCIYSGSRDDWHLCDYILIEGKPRGCPAGVGCIQKKTKTKTSDVDALRVCEMCGKKFEGSKYRRLCDACGKERQRLAGQHMNAMRMKKLAERQKEATA